MIEIKNREFPVGTCLECGGQITKDSIIPINEKEFPGLKDMGTQAIICINGHTYKELIRL